MSTTESVTFQIDADPVNPGRSTNSDLGNMGSSEKPAVATAELRWNGIHACSHIVDQRKQEPKAAPKGHLRPNVSMRTVSEPDLSTTRSSSGRYCVPLCTQHRFLRTPTRLSFPEYGNSLIWATREDKEHFRTTLNSQPHFLGRRLARSPISNGPHGKSPCLFTFYDGGEYGNARSRSCSATQSRCLPEPKPCFSSHVFRIRKGSIGGDSESSDPNFTVWLSDSDAEEGTTGAPDSASLETTVDTNRASNIWHLEDVSDHQVGCDDMRFDNYEVDSRGTLPCLFSDHSLT